MSYKSSEKNSNFQRKFKISFGIIKFIFNFKCYIYNKKMKITLKELRQIIKSVIKEEATNNEYYLELHISNGQSFRFNDELPEGDQFSYIIYDWMRKNAHQNYAILDDESETELTFTFKIDYPITEFPQKFISFLKTKMFDAKFDVQKGNNLYAVIKKL